jgi:UDP-2,3-diacylglucosamine pyrophosphatase LpxH
VNSKWQLLFPLLKARDTVYVFGNHDRQEWTDQRVNQFSVCQRKGICIQNGTKHLLVTHGDAIIPVYEDFIPGRSLRFLCSRTWIRLEAIGIRLVGKRFSRVGAATNATLKTFAKQRLDEDEILVCGHSHLSEYDLDSNFINLGLHRQGLGQYLMVDDHAIELLEETYS